LSIKNAIILLPCICNSKLALVNKHGAYVPFDGGLPSVIYPNAPQNKIADARAILLQLLRRYPSINLISIGDGTASRETAQFVSETLAEITTDDDDDDSVPKMLIVSEAGASVYSVSKEAKTEFPTLIPELRSAVSIARRVQDPLAELVKIDPKSIGVGMYQHDVPPKMLASALDDVVESCVNLVGCDVNTASVALLRRISGLNENRAKKMVNARPFVSRENILKVPGIGATTYQQCAGFLRVYNGSEWLDQTNIHPESYKLAGKAFAALGVDAPTTGEVTLEDDAAFRAEFNRLATQQGAASIAKSLDTDAYTVQDIVKFVSERGVDPRDSLPQPQLLDSVRSIEQLSVGMVLEGTVRNITPFGVFVDIGIKSSGLVHVRELPSKDVLPELSQASWEKSTGTSKNLRRQRQRQQGKNTEVLEVGHIVKVGVLGIDIRRQRVALTMRPVKLNEFAASTPNE
jgi:protein Tex